MRLLHLSALSCAALCLAANADAGSQPISAPLDGQIALTAHNNGDGTWAVKRGPDGPILKDGLPREQALAIVGGATGPYEPENEQEADAAAQRAVLEQREAEREERDLFAPDPDASLDELLEGQSMKAAHDAAVARAEQAEASLAEANKKLAEAEGAAADQAQAQDALKAAHDEGVANAKKADEENGDLRRSLASKDEEIRQLQEQIAKFDPDGDGKVGGSAPKSGAAAAVSKTAGEGPSKTKNGAE